VQALSRTCGRQAPSIRKDELASNSWAYSCQELSKTKVGVTMPDHGEDYERMLSPEGEEIGVLDALCGHHCGVKTVGQAHQLIRHCPCTECHGSL
jgi:hypothetical protein